MEPRERSHVGERSQSDICLAVRESWRRISDSAELRLNMYLYCGFFDFCPPEILSELILVPREHHLVTDGPAFFFGAKPVHFDENNNICRLE